MKTLPLKIAFLDVGHGDSIVIILPDENSEKRAIVIDTPNHKKTIEFLEKNNVKILDLVLITHFDSDHSQGISAVVKHFQKENRIVKSISYNMDRAIGNVDDRRNFINLLKQLVAFDKKDGIKTIVPIIENNEKRISFHNINDFCISILYPNQAELSDASLRKNANDTSTVLMLKYNEFKVLLTGDLESEGWASLIKRNKNINCNILKLPHHGAFYMYKNDDSVGTEQVLNFTSPKIGIISTAQNSKYQHPNLNTITQLKERKIYTMCTQATEICHKDRNCIFQGLLNKLGIDEKNYNSNWCPCSGDIVITIDDKIEFVPEMKISDEIKNYFDTPQCILT